jgi:hypothetical protein
MNRPPAPRGSSVLPTAEHAQLALGEVAALMAPIVRWLLRSGVPYPIFSDVLKKVFVDVARDEIERGGAAATQSALSVLSGVHRKDVRAMTAGARRAPQPQQGVPLASQVFTRWLSDPAYRGADGGPRALPRTGPAPSFDALARAVSTDVHPRTVLEELLRLGVVAMDDDRVEPRASSFVPAAGLAELFALFAANAADHLAAAVHNLTRDGPKFLEQSVFADGLSEDSAQHLAGVAREAWAAAFATMVAQASARVEQDRSGGGAQRIRFGAYFYTEAESPAPAVPAGADDRPKGSNKGAVRARGKR